MLSPIMVPDAQKIGKWSWKVPTSEFGLARPNTLKVPFLSKALCEISLQHNLK